MNSSSPSAVISYFKLMRLNRPIGIYLVLWPALWALWIAAEGIPSWDLIAIFVLGAVVMRSAGCVINDYADRKVDGHVARTKERPLVTGDVSARGAIILFVLLLAIALGLVLLTNRFTLYLSVGGALLAFCYPFMKRYTYLPQVVLGAAFAWAVPMAFAALSAELDRGVWLLYTAVVMWTVTFDTFYAMVDRDDDIKIGVKSIAILLGDQDKLFVAILQAMVIASLVMVGQHFSLGLLFYLGLCAAAAIFVYQQRLVRRREPENCFRAFLNNNWVGMVVFIGIAADFALQISLEALI